MGRGERGRRERGRARRSWSEEEKARIVSESFVEGERVKEVARRNGVTAQQLSVWRGLSRHGERERRGELARSFATVEVEPSAELGAVAIEAFGMTVRREGESSARRIADVLDRIADLPQTRLHELLSWNWKAERQQALAA